MNRKKTNKRGKKIQLSILFARSFECTVDGLLQPEKPVVSGRIAAPSKRPCAKKIKKLALEIKIAELCVVLEAFNLRHCF